MYAGNKKKKRCAIVAITKKNTHNIALYTYRSTILLNTVKVGEYNKTKGQIEHV